MCRAQGKGSVRADGGQLPGLAFALPLAGGAPGRSHYQANLKHWNNMKPSQAVEFTVGCHKILDVDTAYRVELLLGAIWSAFDR